MDPTCKKNDGKIELTVDYYTVNNTSLPTSQCYKQSVESYLNDCDIYLNSSIQSLDLNNEKACLLEGETFSGNINVNNGILVLAGKSDLSLTLSKGEIYNFGNTKLLNFNMSPLTNLINYDTLSFINNVAINSKIENYGYMKSQSDFNINNGASLYNYCTIELKSRTIIGENSSFINNASLIVENELRINNEGNLFLNKNSSSDINKLWQDGNLIITDNNADCISIDVSQYLGNNTTMVDLINSCNPCNCEGQNNEVYPKVTLENTEGLEVSFNNLTQGKYFLHIKDEFGNENIQEIHLNHPDCHYLYSDNFNSTTLEIYPNPFNNNVTIQLPDSSTTQYFSYLVTDSDGRTITYGEGNEKSFIWDGKNLRGWDVPSGIYIVRLRLLNNVITSKIFKD